VNVRWGAIVSVAMLAAVASPLWHGVDSFPLSTFPMFSKARPAEVDIDHVVAVDAQGNRWALPPSLVMRGEVLQTKVAITEAIRGRRARDLCRDVAARLEDPAVVSVEVRSDRYRVSEYFANRKPIESRVHARCKVPR
jgi:hypothetical protein